ncbi:ATPase [Klebsiella pneumoniae]|nr:ATPase [Klebsiella pneumoniae]
MYWQGFAVPQICEMLQTKRPTVQSWKQRDGWEETAPINRVESTLEARLIQLYAKPDLTPHDFKVADFLSRQMERLARVNRYGQTGNEVDLNPSIASRNKGIAKSRNVISSVMKRLKNWRRFSSTSRLTISSTGIRQASRIAFATSSNRARLAQRSTLLARRFCAPSKPGKPDFFVSQ